MVVIDVLVQLRINSSSSKNSSVDSRSMNNTSSSINSLVVEL